MVWRSIPGGGKTFRSYADGPGAHPASCKMGIGFLSRGLSGRSVVLTTQPYLAPWLKKE